MIAAPVFNTPGSAWTSRQTLFAVLAILGFWALSAAVWPLSGSVVPWDSKNHFYPMLRYLGASLANGEWPLWNPYHFSGHPAAADPQSLLFTPTMLFFGWLVPSPSMQLFDVVIFAHFLPGALGIAGLFRRRRWHSLGAVLAAMVFILGGSASARLQHTGMIFSYGFFPLAFYLLEETLERKSLIFAAGFATVAALMTVGRDQVAFLSALALIGLFVHRVIEAPAPLPYIRERIPALGTAALIGAALLAVPTLLTVQFLMTSNRPSIAFNVAAMGSLPPQSLATFFFSDIFGSLRHTYDYWGPGYGTLPEGSWTDRSINYLFAGTLPALLIMWHGIAGGRLLAREFRLFLLLGAAALIYALGWYTPVFTLIFEHVPGVDLYRRPADATFLVNFVAALAVGYLVHRYLKDGLPSFTTGRRFWKALASFLSLAGVAALIAFAYPFAAKTGHGIAMARDVGFGLGLALLLALLLSLKRQTQSGRLIVASLAVCITGGELIARNAASALNAEPGRRYAVFEELPPEQLRGLQVLSRELQARHQQGQRPRVEILGLGGPWQNAAMVFGIEDTLGYNPLRISEYERAVGPGENSGDPSLRHFPGTFKGYRGQLAKLLGLEYLVLDRPMDQMPKNFPKVSDATLLYGVGSMWIYRLSPTAPRAYLATKLIPVDSEAQLDEQELPAFDRRREALIDQSHVEEIKGDYGLKDQTTDPDPANANVAIRGYRRNAVVIEVETDRDGVLVLHDIAYPGWEAYVDGEQKPILRANLLFRAVEVPAGRHRVEFRFRPLSMENLVTAATGLVFGLQNSESETVSDIP